MNGKPYMTRRGRVLLLLLGAAGILLLCYQDFLLLRQPDPIQEAVYEYSFKEGGVQSRGIVCRVAGFAVTRQGLVLAPGAAGTVVFSVQKSPGQGCLVRLWLYGDDGRERPNAVRCSRDGGYTFVQLAGSANHIGTVLDITPQVAHAGSFQLLCEAVNRAPFSQVVFEKLQLVVTANTTAQPPLPGTPALMAIVLGTFLIGAACFSGSMSNPKKLQYVLLAVIIALAVVLRWNELVRIAGTPLDPDAVEYVRFAKKMALFTNTGFYSASFGIREPMYMLVVKLFYAIFGPSDTHLRLVSFVFSLSVVVLTYHLGTAWFNSFVGLGAALFLTVHPYLIELSARGLREEWFTALLLCFLYEAFIKKDSLPLRRTLTTGVLAGILLLTRTEYLPALALIMLLLPRFAAAPWHWRQVSIALFLAFALLAPHLYRVYEKHGTPFDGINKVTRFYIRNEQAQTNTLEASQDTESVTPFSYFFMMHTPSQFIRCWIKGLVKIYVTMPLQFAYGKGNRELVRYLFAQIVAHPTPDRIAAASERFCAIVKKDFGSYAAAFLLLALFLVGVVLTGLHRYWLVLLLMVILQLHTSFLAVFDLDPRLTVPGYPFFACCCGFALYRICRHLPLPKQVICNTVRY